MPLKPLTPDREYEFTPPSQLNDPEPTVFLLRPLTHEEQRHLDNKSSYLEPDGSGENVVAPRTGDVLWLRVKFGLAGVKQNYAVPFKLDRTPLSSRPCVTDAFINSLPRTEFVQLAARIRELAEPSDLEPSGS